MTRSGKNKSTPPTPAAAQPARPEHHTMDIWFLPSSSLVLNILPNGTQMHCPVRTPVIGRRLPARAKTDKATGFAFNKPTVLDSNNYAIISSIMTEIQLSKSGWKPIIDKLATEGLLIRTQFHEFALGFSGKIPAGGVNPMQGYFNLSSKLGSFTSQVPVASASTRSNSTGSKHTTKTIKKSTAASKIELGTVESETVEHEVTDKGRKRSAATLAAPEPKRSKVDPEAEDAHVAPPASPIMPTFQPSSSSEMLSNMKEPLHNPRVAKLVEIFERMSMQPTATSSSAILSPYNPKSLLPRLAWMDETVSPKTRCVDLAPVILGPVEPASVDLARIKPASKAVHLAPADLAAEEDGDITMVDAKDDRDDLGLPRDSVLGLTEEDEIDIMKYCMAMQAAYEYHNHLLEQCRIAAAHVKAVKAHQRAVAAGTADDTMARPIATPDSNRLARAYKVASETQQRADHRYQIAQTVYYAVLRREWVPTPISLLLL